MDRAANEAIKNYRRASDAADKARNIKQRALFRILPASTGKHNGDDVQTVAIITAIISCYRFSLMTL